MNEKLKEAMERAAELSYEFREKPSSATYSEIYHEGFKKAHSPEIIAMLEPEVLLANPHVKELLADFKNVECTCLHGPCGGCYNTTLVEKALAKFQKGGE